MRKKCGDCGSSQGGWLLTHTKCGGIGCNNGSGKKVCKNSLFKARSLAESSECGKCGKPIYGYAMGDLKDL